MLQRPDRVPRPGRAHRRGRWTTLRQLTVLRWSVIGVWSALVVARLVVAASTPDADLTGFGVAETAAIGLGMALIAIALGRARTLRNRREDEALALAIRRIDPTVWLVPAAPTPELRGLIEDARPEVSLGDRVTWAFGATEASLWELDDRRATRLVVIRWSRMMHVGLEDVPEPGIRGSRRLRASGAATAVALHYVRADDSTAVATFFVRAAPGTSRLLRRGPRLERLVAELARERIVA